MNLFGFEFKRVNRVAELEKSLADEVRERAALQAQVKTLEQQAVRVNDMSQMLASLTGGRQVTEYREGKAPPAEIPENEQ